MSCKYYHQWHQFIFDEKIEFIQLDNFPFNFNIMGKYLIVAHRDKVHGFMAFNLDTEEAITINKEIKNMADIKVFMDNKTNDIYFYIEDPYSVLREDKK